MFTYLKATFRGRWKLFLTIGLILSFLGLAYIGTQTVTDQITVEARGELEDDWRYQYDILVLPQLDEEVQGLEDGWVAPQSSIASYGGISIEEWEEIKSIEGVEVAAPIALMGYFDFLGMNANASNATPGNWYEITKEVTAYDGMKTHTLTETSSVREYYDESMEDSILYQRHLEERGYPSNVAPGTSVRYPNEMLLVAIDPEAEDELYNVSESMISGSYLDEPYSAEGATMPVVPVVALQEPEYVMEETVSVYEIGVPDELTEEDIEGGTTNYLRSLPKEELAQLNISSLTSDLRFKNVNLEFDDEGYSEEEYELINAPTEIIRFSPINYNLVENNDEDIPLLEAEEYPNASEFYTDIDAPFYRYTEGVRDIYDFTVDVVGYYDSSEISPKYAGSWQEGDPVDVYTPHHSMIIKNGLGEEVEPTPLLPLPVKASYYPGAPDMLTTLNALNYVYDDEPPLSSIRVVVEGVAERTEESQRKIEAIATEIRERTGNRVEIMLGSSASRVHVNLAGTEVDEVGTVEEGWQQQGVSWSIENQVNQANILLFVYLLAISVIFCFTVITHSLLNRSIDFAMQRAFGWSRAKIIQSLFVEALIISLVPIVSVWFTNYWLETVSLIDYLLVWLMTFIIISIGYIAGSRKALKLSPRDGLAGEGDTWKMQRLVKIRGVLSYCIHQLLRRPLRFGLLATVIAITTFMLLLSFVTQQSLSDFLYLSFIGEAIDVRLEEYQTATLIMSFALAIAVTFLLLYLNINERMKEFFIFRSIGWPKRKIQLYISLETFVVSFVGSSIGTLGAILFINVFTDIVIPTWMISLAILGPILLITFFSIVIFSGMKVKQVLNNQYTV
ncbi:ABC transporter permease [Alkalibacillus haloalkaliphilus]|uniref:ABC transporter permease n=1 Tax=Alkalibacillus haloalkaliphilus TaxID=94136 RepID=UPI002935E899|nr:ABC transporter permease [Alkalibacillus haloalkaliphilus]MDV2580574.1 ABC transporter permease [Alkalibacillus haloalkaliphilus]